MKTKYNYCICFLVSVKEAVMFAVRMTILVGFLKDSGWWRVVSPPQNPAWHKMPVSISLPNGKHSCFLNPVLLLLSKRDSHTCSRLELIIHDSCSTVNPCGIIISWTATFSEMHYHCVLKNTCNIHFSFVSDNATLLRMWKVNEAATIVKR